LGERSFPLPGRWALRLHGAMKHLLDYRRLFVREHVALVKLTDTYDLVDPDTRAVVGIAWENVSGWIKVLRLLLGKSLLPTRVDVAVAEDQPPVLIIRRNVGFLRKKVTVLDGSGAPLGFFKSKILSLGGGFLVYSADGQQFADVKGDWKGWNFKFLDLSGQEMGVVTKKWAGFGKELFTSADNYIVEIKDGTTNNALLLAAAIAIDTVFKEKE
jgi:hypothetical protein